MTVIEEFRLKARSRKFASLILAKIGCVFAIGFAATAASGAEGRLQVQIIDRQRGQAVNARCYLTDAADKFWAPTGADQYNKPPERHFIAVGEFEISLPPGQYNLQIEHGPEYRVVTRAFEIAPGATHQEKIELERWINMNARGWYSGEARGVHWSRYSRPPRDAGSFGRLHKFTRAGKHR